MRIQREALALHGAILERTYVVEYYTQQEHMCESIMHQVPGQPGPVGGCGSAPAARTSTLTGGVNFFYQLLEQLALN